MSHQSIHRRRFSSRAVVLVTVLAAAVVGAGGHAWARTASVSVSPGSSAGLRVVNGRLAGHAVTMEQNIGDKLEVRTNNVTIGDWETFQVRSVPSSDPSVRNSAVALWSQAAQGYVSAEFAWSGTDRGTLHARPGNTTIGPWETFYPQNVCGHTALSVDDSSGGSWYVAVEQGGSGEAVLRARTSAADFDNFGTWPCSVKWELFDAVAGAGGGQSGGGAAAAGLAGAQKAVDGDAVIPQPNDSRGDGPCSTNTLGGRGFANSCTGNGGKPEFWCADFVIWAWSQSGIGTSNLNAAASSFLNYGSSSVHKDGSYRPSPGDAIVFKNSAGTIEHVAIVTAVAKNGAVTTVNGDLNGSGPDQATWAGSARLVRFTIPGNAAAVGSGVAWFGSLNWSIAAYVSPR